MMICGEASMVSVTLWALFALLAWRVVMLTFSGINARQPGPPWLPGQMEPDFPFTTDGCSGGMTILWQRCFGHKPPWEDLCEEHDRAYWRGGTRAQRRKADKALFYGVHSRGYHLWAVLIWAGVRVGGVPWLPTSWRWAYGWRFPRDYVN